MHVISIKNNAKLYFISLDFFLCLLMNNAVYQWLCRVHSMTPADTNKLCLVLIRVFRQKLQKEKLETK